VTEKKECVSHAIFGNLARPSTLSLEPGNHTMRLQTPHFDPRSIHLGGTTIGSLLHFSYLQKSDRSSYPLAEGVTGDPLCEPRLVSRALHRIFHVRVIEMMTFDVARTGIS
jgi:hypothetical protein